MLWPPAMGDDRLLAAIGRIDSALARIEAAADAADHAPRQVPDPDNALDQAHRALRTRVEGAIAQIDRLLERG